jgi:hypothetical protein
MYTDEVVDDVDCQIMPPPASRADPDDDWNVELLYVDYDPGDPMSLDAANWVSPVESVNDDGTERSQFLPRMALDQTSGDVAFSWYDCRNDDGLGGAGDLDGNPNSDAQFFAALLRYPQGVPEVVPNLQVSQDTSDGYRFANVGYFEYTGLAFSDGFFHPAWADNSNSTLDNPDGLMEIYSVPEPSRLLLIGAGISALFSLSTRSKRSAKSVGLR